MESSAMSRGCKDGWSWLSSSNAIFPWIIVTFASSPVAIYLLSWPWEWAEALAGLLVGAIGFVCVVLAFHVFHLAPTRQRDEALAAAKLAKEELEARPRIETVLGEVRALRYQPSREIYAGVSVNVINGPVLNMRGRLVSVEAITGTPDHIPPGLLQWSSLDGGGSQTNIDSGAWLDVAVINGSNWVVIVFADHALRPLHRLYYEYGHVANEWILTIDIGGDNCPVVRKRFHLILSVPRRTVDEDGIETIWMLPDWKPTVTFEAVD